MRERPSARLLVLDVEDRVLLFRFEHRTGPLVGQAFWATPGGGLDPGESFEAAASRELAEETGLAIDDPGPQVARRRAVFQVPSGETVNADERYFLIRAPDLTVSDAHWSAVERAVMGAHRWWSRTDLANTSDQVWPEDIVDILVEAGAWGGGT